MYSTLDVYGFLPTTTNQHFPCPSLGLPTYHLPSPQEGTNPMTGILPSRPSPVDMVMHVSATFASPSPSSSNAHDTTTSTSTYHQTSESMSDKTLLPVMNPAFNLREICKQCILLEDHLSHDQKRCKDCCTKHFLALEALAEEAVTLDRDGRFHDILRTLPERIRSLEIQWMQNPTKHSHHISQQLREIRKLFQEQCFDVIQYECDNGSCRVTI